MRESLGRLMRFGVVGAISTLIYFGIYSGLIVADAPLAVAAVAAFVVSAANGYWLHHHWTFATRAPTTSNFARWLGLQACVLGTNIAALSLLVHAGGLDRIAAQAILLPVIPAMTFLLSRRFVFADPPSD